VQCALAAVKSKEEPYFAVKYQKIRKRRGHKKAIIAVARMMLVCVYNMISTGEAFNPSDYDECRPRVTVKPDISDEAVIAILAGRGYDVSSLVKMAV
jgi:hypothetical protein